MDPTQVQNNVSNESALEYLQQGQTAALRRVYEDAFQIPYLMNTDERAVFDQLLSPRVTIYRDKGKLHRVAHPIAASLQALAYHECKNIANGYDRKIDIGGSFLRTPRDTHLCTLVNDSRSDARYMEGAFNQRSINYDLAGNLISARNYHHKHPSFCLGGAQNCDYKASYAYAINVYDITMEDIAMIFARHHLDVLDMWMFLPHSLIKHFYGTDEKIYTVQYFDNDRALFSLGDQCNAYEHSIRNWRKYLTTTKIIANDFTITVEHKICYGTFTNVRFVRCNETSGL